MLNCLVFFLPLKTKISGLSSRASVFVVYCMLGDSGEGVGAGAPSVEPHPRQAFAPAAPNPTLHFHAQGFQPENWLITSLRGFKRVLDPLEILATVHRLRLPRTGSLIESGTNVNVFHLFYNDF